MTTLRRLLAAVVLTLTALVLTAPGAAAHVSVTSSSTAPGSYAVLTFRVPTESDEASTVGLTVQLPQDTPFTSVRTAPVPGWTAELVVGELPAPVTDGHGNEITEAVTQVVWTATGEGLGPTEFGEFELSVGPLPESGTVFLPALQTYSDGTEVAWAEQAEGGAEPQHPAPSVVVGTDEGDDHTHPADEAAETTEATPELTDAGDSTTAEAEEGAADTGTSSSTGWGIGGFVLGLVGAALGATALLRSRR